MTNIIQEYISTEVLRSLYVANNVLTPKRLTEMAVSDFSAQLITLTSPQSQHIHVSLHNIYAMSVSLGLCRLGQVVGALEDKYKERGLIQDNDIEELKETAYKSFAALSAIDETVW